MSTILYRNIYAGNYPFDFFRPETGDYYLSMMYARAKHFIHVPIVGSRYNAHEGGIYSSVTDEVKELRMRRNLKRYSVDSEFDAKVQRIFRDRFSRMRSSDARILRMFLLRPTIARGLLLAYKYLKKR